MSYYRKVIALFGFSLIIFTIQFLSTKVMHIDSIADYDNNYGKITQDDELFLLDRQWVYYPNQIVDPSEVNFKTFDGYTVSLPHKIDKGEEYGTYHLSIESPYIPELGVLMNEEHDNMKVYINGTLIQENYLYPWIQKLPNYPKIDIVIQVWKDNLFHNGLYGNMMIGSYDQISSTFESFNLINLTTAFTIFILGLYLFALYFFTDKDKVILTYGMFTVMLAISFVLFGTELKVIAIHPECALRLENISYVIAIMLYLKFLMQVFINEGIQIKGINYKIISVILSATIITSLFIGNHYQNIVKNIIYLSVYYILLYSCLRSFELWFAKRAKFKFFLISLYIIGISVVVLLSNDYIFITSSFMYFGLATGILLQTLYFAFQFFERFEHANKVLDENRRMLKEVKEFNVILDKKVKERTKELEDLIKKDPLTELYNHLHIFNVIDDCIRNHQSYNTIYLFMSDLDNFKKVNDGHGHLAGDSVILSISDIIHKHVNNSKGKLIFGRSGGEEFVGLGVNMTFEEFLNEVESIRVELSEIVFEDMDGNSFGVTISGGISEYLGQTFNEFIKEADEQLYNAKKLGKNKICYKAI